MDDTEMKLRTVLTCIIVIALLWVFIVTFIVILSLPVTNPSPEEYRDIGKKIGGRYNKSIFSD
jgi:hypothetical protein